MSKISEAVAAIAAPVAESFGLELWDVEYLREGGTWVLRIFIEKESGVSIDDCENVSRALDPLLDEADPIPGSYVLQVSSAGLERPLRRQSDFERFIGRTVEAGFFAPFDGKKQVTGRLDAYDGQTVTIDGAAFPMKAVSQVRLRME